MKQYSFFYEEDAKSEWIFALKYLTGMLFLPSFIMIFGYLLLTAKPKGETKVVFEDSNTICFQTDSLEVGRPIFKSYNSYTYCVPKDTHDEYLIGIVKVQKGLI